MDQSEGPSNFPPTEENHQQPPTTTAQPDSPAHNLPSTGPQRSSPTRDRKPKPDTRSSPDMDPHDAVSPLDSSAGNPPALSGQTLPGGGNSSQNNGNSTLNNGSGAGAGAGAAQGVAQPKVHTAFIHKLYNMLEDPNIQHLITWSSVGDSFMVTPSNEFSRVLSQYFKHTNVSSFVRQLNMYGFHKVNDVFHTGPPDSTVWEFKHGNGSFKRGDLIGLREIKRRASRHALIQRDSFSSVKGIGNPNSGAVTPNEHGSDLDTRLMSFEHTLYDLSNRMSRTEDANARLAMKCQKLTEGLSKFQQWTLDLSTKVSAAFPQDSPVQRDLQALQEDIRRFGRILEEPQDVMMRDTRQPYIHIDSAPISPRGRPDDEPPSRRPSFAAAGEGYFRTPAPPNLPIPTPRRMGSMSTGPSSPTSLRPPNNTGFSNNNLSPNSYQTPPNHLLRRHTSADIRQHGWNPPGGHGSPFAPNGAGAPPPPHWPPSERKGSYSHDNPREVLASYEIRASQPSNNPFASSHNTPPHENGPHSIADTNWSFQNAKYHPSGAGGGPKENLASSRRGSLVTNSVHALLNPEAALGERDEGVDPLDQDRKRKRVV